MDKTRTQRKARPFWDRVSMSDGCWEWSGARDGAGYGMASIGDGRTCRAHRVAWSSHYGEIPAGMVIMHKCDNPPCCNPGHLRLGTHGDNARDMASKGRSRCQKLAACKAGHLFAPENTRIYRGKRICRPCHAAKNREYKAARRADAS